MEYDNSLDINRHRGRFLLEISKTQYQKRPSVSTISSKKNQLLSQLNRSHDTHFASSARTAEEPAVYTSQRDAGMVRAQIWATVIITGIQSTLRITAMYKDPVLIKRGNL